MALSCLILNTDERGPPVACLLTVPKPQLASNCRRVIAVVFQILKLIIYIIKKKKKRSKIVVCPSRPAWKRGSADQNTQASVRVSVRG